MLVINVSETFEAWLLALLEAIDGAFERVDDDLDTIDERLGLFGSCGCAVTDASVFSPGFSSFVLVSLFVLSCSPDSIFFGFTSPNFRKGIVGGFLTSFLTSFSFFGSSA